MLVFFQFGTSYPLYRYEIAHNTIQKENGKRKAFSLDKRLGQRKGISSLVFCFLFLFFRQGGGTRAKGWQEKSKTVYKEPECKGMHILTNLVDFSHLLQVVVLNSEMSSDWQNLGFYTYIPILGVIRNEISIRLAELQQKKKKKKNDFWACKTN